MRKIFAAELADAEQTIQGQLLDVVRTLAWAEAVIPSPTRATADRLAADGRSLRQASRDLDLQLLRLVALQAPVACDLRLLLTMVQIAQHCGLIANQFGLISEQLREIHPNVVDRAGTGERLGEMVGLAAEQVGQAAVAFAERDVALAAKLEAQDDRLDQLNRRIFVASLELEAGSEHRERVLRHVLIARSLERIGDNAVAIGVQTKYLVEGDAHGLAHGTPRALSA